MHKSYVDLLLILDYYITQGENLPTKKKTLLTPAMYGFFFNVWIRYGYEHLFWQRKKLSESLKALQLLGCGGGT